MDTFPLFSFRGLTIRQISEEPYRYDHAGAYIARCILMKRRLFYISMYESQIKHVIVEAIAILFTEFVDDPEVFISALAYCARNFTDSFIEFTKTVFKEKYPWLITFDDTVYADTGKPVNPEIPSLPYIDNYDDVEYEYISAEHTDDSDIG